MSSYFTYESRRTLESFNLFITGQSYHETESRTHRMIRNENLKN